MLKLRCSEVEGQPSLTVARCPLRLKLGIPADAGPDADAGIRQGKSAWSRWLKKEEIIGRICVFPRDNTIVS